MPTTRVQISARSFHILLAVLLAYSVAAVFLFVYLVGPSAPSTTIELGSSSLTRIPASAQLQSGVSGLGAAMLPSSNDFYLTATRNCTTPIAVTTSQGDTLHLCVAQQ